MLAWKPPPHDLLHWEEGSGGDGMRLKKEKTCKTYVFENRFSLEASADVCNRMLFLIFGGHRDLSEEYD